MTDCNITYEELAAYAAGDTAPEQTTVLCEHISGCEACQKRMDALRQTDLLLDSLPAFKMSKSALLETHRAVSKETHPAQESDIMTLEEAGEFLRLTPEQLDEIAEELPAFEIAGQVRVRRSRLTEWVQQREQLYTRRCIASLAGLKESRLAEPYGWRVTRRRKDRGIA